MITVERAVALVGHALACMCIATFLLQADGIPASVDIKNAMESGVSVAGNCHNGAQMVPRILVAAGAESSFSFDYDPAVNVPKACQFNWVGGTNTQSFPVWTHDGTPHLAICDNCTWKVQDDGFFVLDSADNMFYKMYSWVTIMQDGRKRI